MTALGAVVALAERDLRAIAASRTQLYSSMLTPLLLLLFLGVGVSDGLRPEALEGDFKAFLVAGVAVMTSVFSSTFTAASYYRDRDSGLIRVLLASPLSSRMVLLGKSVTGVVIGSLQAVVVIAVAAPFVDLEWQYGLARGLTAAVLVVVLLNLSLAGLASALSTRVSSMQGFHLIMNLALFPLLFFSGAFFPLEDLPIWFRSLAWINPLTYAVDGLQLATYSGDSDGYAGLWVDLPVLCGLAAIALVGGLAKAPRLTWSGR
ncbi:MAG TPA: ABC transporter permease [Dehalococcoidia bacterium]|nr:ABC transporter permease [Dehalococcoidia bacterium]